MFYWPDTIIQVGKIQTANAAKYVGVRQCDMENVYIPASLHEKRGFTGVLDKRVETDGEGAVTMNQTNQNKLKVGTLVVFKSRPGVIWKIESINYADGLFGGGGVLQMVFSKTSAGQNVPATGGHQNA